MGVVIEGVTGQCTRNCLCWFGEKLWQDVHYPRRMGLCLYAGNFLIRIDGFVTLLSFSFFGQQNSCLISGSRGMINAMW